MHRISIPKGARAVLLNLRYENHEAYVVGGCVRDGLLGKEPKDWDICTSATPDEVKELMHRRDIKTIDTGLQHGTVTVDMGTVGKYEVTTFRIDGNYTDGRHPDYVEFTESIYKDLSRRDFTINAMAYNSAGLIDPFHGRDDLQAGIIRCVGNPDERFEEDALRILRALRFAATYGFSIEEQTAAAIHKDAWMLKRIAAERINGEIANAPLGLLGAVLAVIGWGSEAVLCAWGMKDDAVDDETALQIRETTSALVYGVLVLPLFGAWHFTLGAIPSMPTLIIALAGLAGTASYLFYYKGIAAIGAARAMALNISYSAWSVVFGLILLGTIPDMASVICCVVIVCGTVLAASNWDELFGRNKTA